MSMEKLRLNIVLKKLAIYISCHISCSDLNYLYLQITTSFHPHFQTLFQYKPKPAILSQMFSLIQNSSIDTSFLIFKN